ncbi:AAA family ATPase [Rhizobium rhizogenes]|uniref:AAA family ATPase n=1 Tax=Rhizobium rhizogenes TaxID=359 RepID=UPI00068B3791|nr:ATP-binding protein [Rhizobium rhizogenes]MQB34718.1 ATP-binding protein [Rhizobium rhizogenes]NTG65159.1 ATP-binding protein [Rhizobium rhizogenes]NTG84501.1 ATP-binding protein [Rhizobium rhizogenes]NTI00361.1 ATP-binding protein [Rhizobium rhizogenes]NTI36059.1 ATP-binding protein [Rhizobium rhizogenes]
MQLRMISSYLSVTSFPATTLPEFTLLTGPNGAGKSHFLKAIELGYIQTDTAPGNISQANPQIRFFDWSTLVPQDTGYFASETITNERLALYQQLDNVSRQLHGSLESLRQLAAAYGVAGKYIANPRTIAAMTDDQLSEFISEPERRLEFKAQAEGISPSIASQFMAHFNQDQQRDLTAISEKLKRPLFSLTEQDLTNASIPHWGSSNLFQQSFARLFVAYRNLHLANRLARLRKLDGDETASYLTDAEFVAAHGPAPWDFLNISLREANLGFSINRPDLDSYNQFQPQLTKDNTGVVVPFNNLSSGEKVLMSFAFCVYYSSDRRQLTVYPKIILLDEIDAPLHPSMSRSLISTISDTLVANFGINVIATTHSPSTVALAPEETLHVMRPGEGGVHKVTKADALNILTVGVPTIALSFDGRRQVFVESNADATTYDLIYKVLKPKLSSERSLEFIATGTRSVSGIEQNTGCDLVKGLVQQLSDAGNKSVFGLIDWDGRNQPTNRIVILANNQRNGLENILLDPLLLAALFCRDFPDRKSEVGIPADIGWIEFCSGNAEAFQIYVSNIIRLVLGTESQADALSAYMGGLELWSDKRYLLMDDHELEHKVLTAFPHLQSITKGPTGPAGRMLQHIVTRVMQDTSRFTPVEVQETLRSLLDAPAH